MTTPEMLDYIRHQLALGKSQDEIKQILINTGWHETDVEEGFAEITQSRHAPPALAASGSPASSPAQGAGGSLPGPFVLLGQAWDIYKARFLTLVGISLIPVLLWLGFSLLFGSSAVLALKLNLDGAATLIAGAILAILAVIAIIYISLWSQTALLFAIAGHREAVGFKEAFKRSSHRIGAYFAVIFLTAAVTIGGYALLIIPGIILSLRLVFSQYILASEGTRGLAALQKSRWYTHGFWWAILGRFLLIGILLVLAFFVPAFALQLANQGLAAVAVNWLSTLLLAPISLIYGYLVYENLKNIKGQAVIAPDAKKGGLVALAVWGLAALIILPLVSVGLLALNSARSKSRDAKRVTDVQMLSSGLELYFNDFNKYPASLAELSPRYISQIPLAPQPNDGSCTSLQNEYQYKDTGNGHYALTFCLGAAMAGRPAGVNTMTESGLLSPWQQESYKQPLPQGSAKTSFEQLRQANLTKDETLYRKYLSKSTLNLLDISKELPWQQDFTFVSEKTEGNTRIVTAKVAGGTGVTTEAEWVFVPEEGVWKLDLLESAKRSLDSYKNRQ